MKILQALLILILPCLAACSVSTPAATPVSLPTIPPIAVPQSTPAQVAEDTPAQTSLTLTVMAADSLSGAFTELGQIFETTYPGAKIKFYFPGLSEPGEPPISNASADVVASDSEDDLNSLVQAGLVAKGGPKIFVENTLVLITPKSNPGTINHLQDLARPGLKLALAKASLPLGRYSTTFLTLASGDAAFDSTFQNTVEKNVTVQADSSHAIVSQVAASEVDAGICYTSDLSDQVASGVTGLLIPDSLNVVAVYSIAALSSSQKSAMAQAFVDLVLSGQGQQILKKYGFIPTYP